MTRVRYKFLKLLEKFKTYKILYIWYVYSEFISWMESYIKNWDLYKTKDKQIKYYYRHFSAVLMNHKK